MTKNTTLELDKTWTAGIGDAESYGTVTIRVVVVPPKEDKEGVPIIADPDEPLLEAGGGPLDSYLERPRGEGYVVLLVHGQRHDMLDESFVQRELGFKYLRNRTLIMVDVDGLAPEAIAELVQGSRQGFYRGVVYDAILDRASAVLKKDPDLMRLEADAEQKIAELKTGDETVRRKLDDLIEGHNAASQRALPGVGDKGSQGGFGGQPGAAFADRDVVVHATPEIGDPAEGPALLSVPSLETIRLIPDEQREITIRSAPEGDWSNLETKDLRVVPAVPELQMTVDDANMGALLRLRFIEPKDMAREDYPIKAKLTFSATFVGKTEPRVVTRGIVIAPKKPRPPEPPPQLSQDPSFLRVVSRQPIKLVAGGPSTHVRLRWDGEDHLAGGWPPLWAFTARCLSLESFPAPIFSKPRAGRFELLLDTPHGLLTGQQLEFEVEASGPGGMMLTALFVGEIAEPEPAPEPRRTQQEAPQGSAQRNPPYQLKVVTEAEWDSPCWGSGKWTKDDAGCFDEPNGDTPLTLIVNEDAEMLKAAREQMLARQLDENTIKERLGRYTAHIYFHLYNMYRYTQEMKKQREGDEGVHIPNEREMRAEINRVAVTLASLMDR